MGKLGLLISTTLPCVPATLANLVSTVERTGQGGLPWHLNPRNLPLFPACQNLLAHLCWSLALALAMPSQQS